MSPMSANEVLFKRLESDLLLSELSQLRTVSAQAWTDEPRSLQKTGTTFFYIFDGPSQLELRRGGQAFFKASLHSGMYGSLVDEARLTGGRGLLIHVEDYQGVFQLGGPLEERGRLRYIDGCSDSLIVPPTLRGDPCFNHLHFPPGIEQSFHDHPSARVGLVCRGSGHCESKSAGAVLQQELTPGLAFVIPPGVEHRFCTGSESLDVVAFHPDSNTGPDHDDHPMINRTYVGGVSANELNHIRTQDIH